MGESSSSKTFSGFFVRRTEERRSIIILQIKNIYVIRLSHSGPLSKDPGRSYQLYLLFFSCIPRFPLFPLTLPCLNFPFFRQNMGKASIGGRCLAAPRLRPVFCKGPRQIEYPAPAGPDPRKTDSRLGRASTRYVAKQKGTSLAVQQTHNALRRKNQLSQFFFFGTSPELGHGFFFPLPARPKCRLPPPAPPPPFASPWANPKRWPKKSQSRQPRKRPEPS